MKWLFLLFSIYHTRTRIVTQEKLQLQISIESTGFLKNIIEYGNNRMARRAVGVLQKMPAYRILPQEIHYTEVLEDTWYDTMIL